MKERERAPGKRSSTFSWHHAKTHGARSRCTQEGRACVRGEEGEGPAHQEAGEWPRVGARRQHCGHAG